MLESSLHALEQELGEVTRGLEERRGGRLPPALPALGSPGQGSRASSNTGSAGAAELELLQSVLPPA